MALARFASLCRLSRRAHHKSQAKGPLPANRNFVAEMRRAAFRLCRQDACQRNGMTRDLSPTRAGQPPRDITPRDSRRESCWQLFVQCAD